MSKRTDKVIISPEGRVLKKLREKKGLSMRQLAQMIGKSDSYISQMENGRVNFPKGKTFDDILLALDDIGKKYFRELTREWEKESTDEDFILDNVKKLSKDNQKLIKSMMITMLEK